MPNNRPSRPLNTAENGFASLADPSRPHRCLDQNRRVELVPVGQLVPYRANARTHSRRQIQQIADSIARFGFNNPALVDDDNVIIAGHGRVAAAKLLGWDKVPVLRLSHLSAVERRAYALADNRLADKAGWDQEILATELQGLIDLDFDIELTGFELGEINVPSADGGDSDTKTPKTKKTKTAGPEHPIPGTREGAIVSRPGDLWQLGEHRILCGKGLDLASFKRLLEDAGAEFVFTAASHTVPDNGGLCGTILVAAERTGRAARAIEIDPRQVDDAIKRWQTHTGKAAILAATGQSFVKVGAMRSGSAVAEHRREQDGESPLGEAE